MPNKIYKHNDYYGYINKINEKAISNPEWFWSDNSDASQARQWLYDNGASEIVENIFENTPEELKSRINPKFLPKRGGDEYQKNTMINSMNEAKEKVSKGFLPMLAAPFTIGATTTSIPIIKNFLVNPIVRNTLDIAGTIDSIRNSLSDNGVKKTFRLAKEGNTWGAVKSGIGDLLDFTAIGDTAIRGVKNIPNAYIRHKIKTIPQSAISEYNRKQYFNDFFSNKPSYTINKPKGVTTPSGKVLPLPDMKDFKYLDNGLAIYTGGKPVKSIYQDGKIFSEDSIIINPDGNINIGENVKSILPQGYEKYKAYEKGHILTKELKTEIAPKKDILVHQDSNTINNNSNEFAHFNNEGDFIGGTPRDIDGSYSNTPYVWFERYNPYFRYNPKFKRTIYTDSNGVINSMNKASSKFRFGSDNSYISEKIKPDLLSGLEMMPEGFFGKVKYTNGKPKSNTAITFPYQRMPKDKNAGRNALLRYADKLKDIKDNKLTHQDILLDLDGSNYRKVYEYKRKPLTKEEKLGIPKGERNQPLNGHLKGENAIKMFEEYGGMSLDPNSEIYNKLKKLIPEARIRYGLVNNNNISDNAIINSLYKRSLELSESSSEPLLLFRGDTRRYKTLKNRPNPNDLVKLGGTMDNSLGNLFLGDLPYKGNSGIGQYIATAQKSLLGNGYDVHLSNTGNNIKLINFDKNKIPEGSYLLNPGNKREVWKIPSKYLSSNVNDINPFVMKNPNIRDASSEISVLADPFLIEHGDYYGPKLKVIVNKESGFPSYVNESGKIVGDALYGSEPREYMAAHYNELLKRTQKENQNILLSSKRSPTTGNIRSEHSDYDYYAVPNFSKQNIKHLFGWDLRNKPNWNSDNIYLKNGGKLNEKIKKN